MPIIGREAKAVLYPGIRASTLLILSLLGDSEDGSEKFNELCRKTTALKSPEACGHFV